MQRCLRPDVGFPRPGSRASIRAATEIAIVGEPDADDTRSLLAVAQDGYRPFQVVGLGAPSTQPSPVPLLQDRGLLGGQAAAYVCRDFACQAPVAELEVLRAQLEQR